ncbi:aldehyde dehydrogenase family protein [Mycobacterium xenopi 3993]|nr:aldehyde dehydrogenase family protein [Mycobacterium xenopi 3993]
MSVSPVAATTDRFNRKRASTSTVDCVTHRPARPPTTSTRPLKKCSVCVPTPAPMTWRRRSPPRAGHSTRPTGRPTASSVNTVFGNCITRCRRRKRTCAPSWSRRPAPCQLHLHRAVGLAAGRRGALARGVHHAIPMGANARSGRQDGRALQPSGRQGTDGGGWAITPWNFPFEIISNKMGQILATGNTMVLKPAIETPWSALRWGRIIAEKTDIPAGVVNIVPASDNDIAQRLVTDPRIDMISFTGSTAVGRLIQRLSGDTMKRTLLELGGKSAYIVLDDADMSVALPGCMGALIHSGQGCALATRMLVPASSTTRPSRWRPRHSPQSGAGIRPIRPTSVARWCRPGNATG